MNYFKIYKSIIRNRQINEPINCYYENHHIIPKCLNGKNTKTNIVKLTAREHFLCHYCLIKIFENNEFRKNEYNKMLYAFMMMKPGSISGNHKGQRYINSRLYEEVKIKFKNLQKQKQCGKNNSNYNTIWIKNLSLRENKKIKKEDLHLYLNNDWILGRCQNFTKYEEEIRYKKDIEFEIKEKEKAEKLYFNELYEIWNNNTIEDFYKKTNCSINLRSLYSRFKKYVDEYDKEHKMINTRKILSTLNKGKKHNEKTKLIIKNKMIGRKITWNTRPIKQN